MYIKLCAFRAQDFGSGGRSFIVEESCLRKLMKRCTNCTKPCGVVMTRKLGCGITLQQRCTCGHRSQWDSQLSAPGNKTWMPMANLTLACGIFFSGASPVKAINMLTQAGITCISLRTFFRMQKFYLIPAVTQVWKASQVEMYSVLRQQGAYLGGDARCCSPGHTAKYGSYTIMDMKLNKVVDLELVQVKQNKIHKNKKIRN